MIPDLLKHAAPLREIRLRGMDERHLLDDSGARYEVTVWARPTALGWEGWYKREFVTTDPKTIWLRGLWEETTIQR